VTTIRSRDSSAETKPLDEGVPEEDVTAESAHGHEQPVPAEHFWTVNRFLISKELATTTTRDSSTETTPPDDDVSAEVQHVPSGVHGCTDQTERLRAYPLLAPRVLEAVAHVF
jgi:hypothetical protein